tara:strand:+ start:228 stop:365 length:138 start_codon:yes stop_codon:yes gene_type:complete
MKKLSAGKWENHGFLQIYSADQEQHNESAKEVKRHFLFSLDQRRG